MSLSQQPLFELETYSLDEYVPVFTYEETTLHLQSREVQIGGGLGLGVYDEDRPGPKYETRYSITLPGDVVVEQCEFPELFISMYDGSLDIAAKIANSWLLKYRAPQRRLLTEKAQAAYDWLSANAEKLNHSKRYWAVIKHQQKINEEEERIRHQLSQLERAKKVVSLNSYEVLHGRKLTDEERRVKWAEITGGNYGGLPQPT